MISAIFDLDGTLVESAPGIYAGIRYALQKGGIPEGPESMLRACVGPPLLESFCKFWSVTPDESQRLTGYYREYYNERGQYENRLYRGIKPLLVVLRRAGVPLYVCTGKPLPYAEPMLKRLQAGPFLAMDGPGMGMGTYHKNAALAAFIKQEKIINPVMIGDRYTDIEAAQAAGIPSVGALWGYAEHNELQGASYLAKTPREAGAILLALHAREHEK